METIQEEKRIALKENQENISFLKDVIENVEKEAAEHARPSQRSARPSGVARPERLYSHD